MNYNTYINRWLTEAITVGRDIQLTSPLKDSDVIRVYHGFYNPLDAIKFCKYGVSGKELADRAYSFESNNNPYGLFVTPQFEIAKRFAGSYQLGKNEKGETDNLSVILEVQSKVKDLEAPVWPGGGFTVQGQMSQYWDNSGGLKSMMADREKGRLKQRQDILQSDRKDLEFVKQSDRPELAFALSVMGEPQALFIGDLNPNMIRAVWIYTGSSAGRYGTFKRVSRQEFLDQYEHLLIKSKKRLSPDHKVYNPNDEWKGLSDFADRFVKQSGYSKSEIENYLDWTLKSNKSNLIDTLEQSLWPKQLKQAIKDLDLDPENKYFIP